MSDFPTPWRLELTPAAIELVAANGLRLSHLANNAENRDTAKLMQSAHSLLILLQQLMQAPYMRKPEIRQSAQYINANKLLRQLEDNSAASEVLKIETEDDKLSRLISKAVAHGLAAHEASQDDKQPPTPEREPREHYGTDPNIGKVLLLSTGQALLPNPNFQPCRSEETEYGWVVWPRDQEANTDFEDWFGEINMWAYQNGYHMIEFDRDNEPHPRFRCFEDPEVGVADKDERDKKSPADFNKEAAEFVIKHGSSPVNVMAAAATLLEMQPPPPSPRFNKNITKADGFSAIQNYFEGRAPQLLWNGYKPMHVVETADGGFATWSGYGKTFITPYLYLECRANGKYKNFCRAVCIPVLTIDDCGLGSYLTRHEIDHIEVTLPPEYRLIEEYYAGKSAKRTGLPYMRHIDDGLRILRAMSELRDYETVEDQRQWMQESVEAWYKNRFELLTRTFCVHPIYQDNNPEWRHKHLDIGGAKDAELCHKYASYVNSYLPAHVDRANCPRCLRGSDLWALLVADKLQNYADFNANANKFSTDETAQLQAYFTDWFAALKITTNHLEVVKQYYETI